jgi:hypothetical protein
MQTKFSGYVSALSKSITAKLKRLTEEYPFPPSRSDTCRQSLISSQQREVTIMPAGLIGLPLCKKGEAHQACWDAASDKSLPVLVSAIIGMTPSL